MAKEKTSKTNVQARAQEKAQAALCRFCGHKAEVVLRVPPDGRKHMVRLCCERAGVAV
ncbi:MAG: hypothetical protein HY320_11205 [Armatimonadetes bacterium]|nr:hypothetical protein [Armatimonadota bacterium]